MRLPFRRAESRDRGQPICRVRPGSGGPLFAVLLVLLLLAAINYANALLFGFSFFLMGIGAAAAILAFRNLRDLTVSMAEATPGFAGERLSFPITVTCAGRGAEALHVEAGNSAVPVGQVVGGRSQALTLPVLGLRRGPLIIEEVRISSEYPLGLFRIEQRHPVYAETLVFPRPTRSRAPAEDIAEQGGPKPGDDEELIGLRGHRDEDPPQRIAWKALAAGRGLLAKEFSGSSRDGWRLSLSAMPGKDLEERLALLCRGVLEAEKAGVSWLLDLDGATYGPARGGSHQARCLAALAHYPEPAP